MSDVLRACPFCGGDAERIDIDEGENAGGSCIQCTRCLASGNVEFDRKENFVANWNRRAALAPVTDEEVAGIRERHEADRKTPVWEPDFAQALIQSRTDRATLLRRDEQREAELGRLREVVERLTDCQPVPKVYKYTGTAEVDVENMFDVGHRHKNGKQPRDYLMSWLSMFRPFAYATKDDSWGELEKLISIVMNNYVQVLVRAEKARAAPEPKP